jgi:hypothetical protein
MKQAIRNSEKKALTANRIQAIIAVTIFAVLCLNIG